MAEAYTVVKIDELSRVSDTKGLEKYYRVTIRSRLGTVLTVDVSEADFTPERMKPILQTRAVEADKIKAL